MKALTKSMQAELDRLADRSKDHKLRASAVVRFARDKRTALHKAFDWDDAKAATRWRLEQARNLIQVYVVSVGGEEQRAFVSIENDRSHGGGYLRREDALSQEVTRELLLRQFKGDLARVVRQYSYLRPFDEKLFAVLDDAVGVHEAQGRQGVAAPPMAAMSDGG